MSTKPMTQEQLDAIRERAGAVTTLRSADFSDWQELALDLSEHVDDLLAEVKRLRVLTTVDDDMVERVARAMCDARYEPGTWEHLSKMSRAVWRYAARAAMDALEDIVFTPEHAHQTKEHTS